MTNVRKTLFAIAMALIATINAKAADGGDCTIGDMVFTAESGTFANVALPYRKAVTNTGATDKPMLVVYLHGGSSKGNDNATQMGEKGIDSIANYLSARDVHAVFLVPQCPADKSWGGQMNAVVKSLIDNTVTTEGIDANRIYIFGGSMGGTGTWGLVSAYPGLFAAAMPVAGNPSRAVAENVAQTPVYAVMGTADAIMKVETVSDFIGSLKEMDGETALDIVEGWTHETTCIQSYSANRLDWVFGHSKNNPAAIEETAAEVPTSNRLYTIDGRPAGNAQRRGLYIEKRTYAYGHRATYRKIVRK